MSFLSCCMRPKQTEYVSLATQNNPISTKVTFSQPSTKADTPQPSTSPLESDRSFHNSEEFSVDEVSKTKPQGHQRRNSTIGGEISFNALSTPPLALSKPRMNLYKGQPIYKAVQLFLGLTNPTSTERVFTLSFIDQNTKASILACKTLVASKVKDDLLSSQLQSQTATLVIQDQVGQKYTSLIHFNLKNQDCNFTLTFPATVKVTNKTATEPEKIKIRPKNPITFTSASKFHYELKGTLSSAIIGRTFSFLKIKESQTKMT